MHQAVLELGKMMNNRTFLLSAIAAILIGVSTSVFAQEDPLRKYCPEGNCLEIGKKPKKAVKLYREVHVIDEDEIPRRADWEGALYLPQSRLQDAMERLADGGTIYLHKGEYDYNALSWRRRASFNIEAWSGDRVMLRPRAQCLFIDPVFHPRKDEPVITLKNLIIAPQSLLGESCIETEHAKLSLNNVEIDLSAVQGKRGVRVLSGELTVNGKGFKDTVVGEPTNEGVLVDPGATLVAEGATFSGLKTGVHILPADGIVTYEEVDKISHFCNTRFESNTIGLMVDGVATVDNKTAACGKTAKKNKQTEGDDKADNNEQAYEGGYAKNNEQILCKEKILFEDGGVQLPNFAGNRVGVLVSGMAKIKDVTFYDNGAGIEASGRLAGTLRIDCSRFEGAGQSEVGVEIRAPEGAYGYAGNTKIAQSTFSGLYEAIVAAAGVEIGSANKFGLSSSVGIEEINFASLPNKIAVKIPSGAVNSFYRIHDNEFHANDVSLSIADNFVGNLEFSGNTGELRKGRKKRPSNNVLQINDPKSILIQECTIGTASLDLEFRHKKRGLGRVNNCRKGQQQR